ncbi:MAG: hypothetical protein ISR83_09315 [Candidatus Marinimicrobia bacterium]|nr:hypothetical protein [Candidatus Neomarinimicrobiota bacterium]
MVINKISISNTQKLWMQSMMVLGVLAFFLGLYLDPTRTWSNVLLSGYFLTGIGFCGIMMVAIHYVSNAGWDVAIRRVPEAMYSVLPIGFGVMALLYFGMHDIYEWSHADVVAEDPILSGKSAWLNPTGFMFRMAIYFVFWIWVGGKIITKSQAMDLGENPAQTSSPTGLSAFWLYIGGIMFVFSSFDWIMSLEPHWYSTIFGLYNFSGMFTSGLAFIMIVLILLRRNGLFKETVKIDHLYELARYLFGFTTFWVYIWFSQHMLIWYANIPEETVYYIKRHVGVFGSLTVVNILLNWFVPFSILLFRKTKRNEKSLLIVASLVLVGRWVDLYMMIFPSNFETPVFGIIEIIIFVGSLSAMVWVFIKAFNRKNPIPQNDPYLSESLHLHT